VRWPAAIALLLLLPPGCLYVGGRARVGAALPADAVASIEPGRTTMAQVLQLLGPPTEYRRPELGSALVDDELRLSGVLAVARRAGHVLTWQFDRVSADGTALVLFNGLWSETRSDLLVVFLDEHDIVRDIAFRAAADRDAARAGAAQGRSDGSSAGGEAAR